MIYYREHSNKDVLTPADLLAKAYKEMGANFDLYCEDLFEENKPHWAFDNYRINGAMGSGASHLFYTQPGWGKYFADLMGREKVKLLTYAVDEEIYPEIESKEIYDVGFIGNINDDDGRSEVIDFLQRNFKCYISTSTPTREIAKELSQCKVVFNHIRYEEINIRFFESLACGAQVVSYSPALHLFAKEYKHYMKYRTLPELSDVIKFLINFPDVRKTMKKAARAEVLKRHTYKQRVIEIISHLT